MEYNAIQCTIRQTTERVRGVPELRDPRDEPPWEEPKRTPRGAQDRAKGHPRTSNEFSEKSSKGGASVAPRELQAGSRTEHRRAPRDAPRKPEDDARKRGPKEVPPQPEKKAAEGLRGAPRVAF